MIHKSLVAIWWATYVWFAFMTIRCFIDSKYFICGIFAISMFVWYNCKSLIINMDKQ